MQMNAHRHNLNAIRLLVVLLVALLPVGGCANPRSLGPARMEAATATPAVNLSREQAIEAALELARSPQVEISPAQVPPQNVQAVLTTYAEVQRQEMHIPDDLLSGTDAGGRLVWLVIMEGRWESGFPMPTGVPTPEPYPRYMVVLDAMTGEQLMVASPR